MSTAQLLSSTDIAGDSPLDAVIGSGLRAVFQPIVRLEDRRPVGLEALIRGPLGSPLEMPTELFAAARRADRLAALDWASRHTALTAVHALGLQGPAALFLNAEPLSIAGPAWPTFDALTHAVGAAGIQVVVEVTERSLTAHPAELLRVVQHIRERGWRLAIDDVGAEPASLALMPFLAPDVIKLDLRLIQQRTTTEIAEIVNAVLMQREQTGAVILAEGIETEAHLRVARSMGAELGQGWLFGRPEPLRPESVFAPLRAAAARPPVTPPSPWDLAAQLPDVRTSAKPLLVAMSQTLERQALAAGRSSVVLGAFQREDLFTPHTSIRYTQLAKETAFVAALGRNMVEEPAPGVRGSSLRASDPLLHEWDVVVVGAHFAGALLARERSDSPTGPEAERLFDYVMTYDRARVLAAARSLMWRVAPRLTEA